MVCMSDTHCKLEEISVPDGDILIHAGDFTYKGTTSETKAFLSAFTALPHRYKVVIAGNHDLCIDPSLTGFKANLSADYIAKSRRLLTENQSVIYLEDSGTQLYGYNLWGSPWIPKQNRAAFTLPRKSQELAALRSRIPVNTDILVTHCPPRNYCDYSVKHGKPVGCDGLAGVVREQKPVLSVFGHIHEGHGLVRSEWGGLMVNAAICNREFQAVNQPIVVDLPVPKLTIRL